MAMYVIALITMPCTDACAADAHSTPLIFSQTQDHHDEDQDTCSPLCACSCCSTQWLMPSPFLSEGLSHLAVEQFMAYHHPFQAGPCQIIWQPPRRL